MRSRGMRCSALSRISSARFPSRRAATLSARSRPGSSSTARACAIDDTSKCASRSDDSGTHQMPSWNESAASAAAWIARRVLPVPPGPVSVTSRALSPSRLRDLGQLLLPAEERRRRHRQVRPVQRLERRERRVSELVHALGSREVLEAVLAEVGERELGEARRCCGNEHLAAVAGGGDARGSMDVVADVALVREQRRARVQPGSHADRALRRAHRSSPRRPRAAPGAVGNAKKNASPCVSTSTPPSAAQASRIARRCSARASA